MKRRLEEPGKPVDASGGYPTSSSPLSSPPIRLPPRTLTPVVGQSSYAPAVKPTSELRAVQGFPTFTTTMPAVIPTIKVHSGAITPPASANSTSASQQQIQRLKVEDALSYLDMVKFKFGDQPQVYNDFLDIMKEFKSQSIDTPGVIDRVSNLFNGHPELIVGFNTFLPPGYKIEVKTNDQGYSFQVQVSMPSPSAGTTTMVPATPIVHHTTQLPTIPIPVPTTVVTKPLLLASTTVVTHGNTAAAVVPPPPPVPATTPPHFTAHTLTPAITQVQAHQAVSQALSHAENTPPPTPQSQPVEFNHAINYVNKIKNRFQGQPDKYKRFLEILHTYQKEQRNLKEGVGSGSQCLGTKQLTEAEVYSQVAKLFEHQEDLLAEFGQFLPDATNHQTQLTRRCEEPSSMNRKPAMNVKMGSSFNSNTVVSPSPSPVSASGTSVPVKVCNMSTAGAQPTSSTNTLLEAAAPQVLKRSSSMTLHHPSPSPSPSTSHQPLPAKKQKLATSVRDVSFAEAAKYGTLTDFAFFDKVRRALRTQDVYDNFLRCVNLYICEVVNRCELMQLVTPFLNRFPELFRWFREYIGHVDGQPVYLSIGPNSPAHNSLSCESMMNSINRPGGDHSEIDFASCKRLSASYIALPRNRPEDKCSGRTSLCQKVLNDTWVSFPTWSEESTFVTSRKNQFEEYIYRCEDERFELDMVLEVNAAAVRILDTAYKKLCQMSSEEAAKFRFEEYMSPFSPTIYQRAIARVYGDKCPEIVDGMKKNPLASLPIVVKRLKAKDEEWREAQKAFNKAWRETNDKYYLKSLDHQGINFKQVDVKILRSKSLFSEIEACCEERHEQSDASGMLLQGPHMTLSYRDKTVLDDAANLLIHHTKRQTSVHKEDKQRIKHMLRQFIPDLFNHPRQELSEDERDTADDKRQTPSSPNTENGGSNKSKPEDKNKDDNKEDDKQPIHAVSTHPDEAYTLFFGNVHWYMFFRYHQILCERLTLIYEQANILTQEEINDRNKECASSSLRLKPKCESLEGVNVEDYYGLFLEMVKNVLDNSMDSNNFEDTLREMFGIHAYHAFTMDKVVSYTVRQLQHLVSDEMCTECEDLFLKFKMRAGTGGPCATAYQRVGSEAAYQRKAELLLAKENKFKIFIYKVDCKLTIEFLGNNYADGNGTPPNQSEKWTSYCGRYAKSGTKDKDETMDADEDLDSEQERRLWGKAIFLPRNVRLWHDRVGHNNANAPKIDHHDDTECKFNLNSYKMVFVLDRESYLYKRQALTRARKSHKPLSERMKSKFREWHQAWADSNLSEQQIEFAGQWMLGNLPDYRVNQTRVLTDNPLDKAPYHPYNRYRVTYK